MMELAINILVFAGMGSWVTFAVSYALRTRWWRTAVGRNVMAVSVAIFALLGLAIIYRVAPDWGGRPWVQLFVYSAVILLGIQRTVQMVRVQRDSVRGESRH